MPIGPSVRPSHVLCENKRKVREVGRDQYADKLAQAPDRLSGLSEEWDNLAAIAMRMGYREDWPTPETRAAWERHRRRQATAEIDMGIDMSPPPARDTAIGAPRLAVGDRVRSQSHHAVSERDASSPRRPAAEDPRCRPLDRRRRAALALRDRSVESPRQSEQSPSPPPVAAYVGPSRAGPSKDGRRDRSRTPVAREVAAPTGASSSDRPQRPHRRCRDRSSSPFQGARPKAGTPCRDIRPRGSGGPKGAVERQARRQTGGTDGPAPAAQPDGEPVPPVPAATPKAQFTPVASWVLPAMRPLAPAVAARPPKTSEHVEESPRQPWVEGMKVEVDERARAQSSNVPISDAAAEDGER